MSNFTVGESSNIEHLGWTAQVCFLAYGLTIAVRVNDSQLTGLLPRHLPCGSKAESGTKNRPTLLLACKQSPGKLEDSRQRFVLFEGNECLAKSLDQSEALDSLGREARLFVAEHARRRIFVHAGVVAWNGRAIVIPGESMSGKTSLTAEFVRAGADYYSDEYAVFDEQGRVHPYAKPLSIRDKDGDSQTDYPVEAFGGRAGIGPLPVGLVLVTRYRKGSRWQPRQITAGMGALSLLANTVAARKEPARSLDVLQNVLHTAPVLKSVRGEAACVVASVLRSNDLAPVSSKAEFL